MVNDGFIATLLVGLFCGVFLTLFVVSGGVDSAIIPIEYVNEHICINDTEYNSFDREDWSVVCTPIENVTSIDCDKGAEIVDPQHIYFIFSSGSIIRKPGIRFRIFRMFSL